VSVTGIWLGEHEYRISDSETGRSGVSTIITRDDAGNEVYDNVELRELEHFARDQMLKWWKAHEERKPLPVQIRKDLGATLKEIHASHLRQAEVGHGRYW
jgi:ribose 1,5-bisphosphokinase PhnN